MAGTFLQYQTLPADITSAMWEATYPSVYGWKFGIPHSLAHRVSDVIHTNTDITVLCVDDEPELRAELAEGLENAGCKVLQASNGVEGATKLDKHPEVTVIISDVRMAYLDGISMARSIAENRDEKHAVEIIMITAHATTDMVIEALRIKVLEFMRKPARLRDILGAVRSAHAKAMERRTGAELQDRLQEALRRLRDLEQSQRPPGVDAESRSLHRAVINDALRNPLVPIAGFAELIESSASSEPHEKILEYARQIRLAGAHLTSLIDGIGALIAVWTASAAPAHQWLDTNALCSVLRTINARNAENDTVSIRLDIAADLTIRTDPGLLRLIFELVASDLLRIPGDDLAGIVIESASSADQTILRMWAPSRLRSVHISASIADASSAPASRAGENLALRHRTLGLATWIAIQLARHVGCNLEANATCDGCAAVELIWHGATVP